MDTTTSYLGLRLPHPFIAGASPLGWHLDTIKRLEDGGCAAIVLHSLFEEQITLARTGTHPAHAIRSTQEFAEALARFPGADDYPLGPDEYAEHISRVKEAVAMPVIGSLNGTSAESWLTFSPRHRAGGRRRAGAEPLRSRDRSRRAGAAVEHQLCARRQGAEADSEDSDRRQAVAVLRGVRQCRPAAGRGRRRRPRALQSLLPARHRHQDDDARRRMSSCRPAPSCCCGCDGWPSFTAGCARRSPSPAASRRRTTASRRCSPEPTRYRWSRPSCGTGPTTCR